MQSHGTLDTSPRTNITQYVATQRRFLQAERSAEIAEVAASATDGSALAALEAAGLAVARLSLIERASAPGGRVAITLATRGGRLISAPRLSTGDIVSVRPHNKPTRKSHNPQQSAPAARAEGVVEEGVLTQLADHFLKVVLADDYDNPAFAVVSETTANHGDAGAQLFSVIRVSSDVTFQRYMAALNELEVVLDDPTHPAHKTTSVLFLGSEPTFSDQTDLQDLHSTQFCKSGPMDSLNQSQKDAVLHALCSKQLAVIHGPPGTGKTSTLVAYIALEVQRGSRVLVAAPSNTAVDNIAEKLAGMPYKVRFVRAGHPARVIPSIIEHTLESRLWETDDAALARDIRNELSGLDTKIKNSRSAERRNLRAEQRILRKELRKREDEALKRLLTNIDVILATTSGAGARILDYATKSAPFDVVCIDEAGQALEVACLVALLRGRRAVIAGDPFQLPPTVKVQDTQWTENNSCRTILDRIFESSMLRRLCVRMLTEQYRMNNIISTWCSRSFYGGNLVPHPSVTSHLLEDMSGVRETPIDGVTPGNIDHAWVLIDTAGCSLNESMNEDHHGVADKPLKTGDLLNASKSNYGEAELIANHVNELISAGVRVLDIGVISPYSGQVKLLRSKLHRLLDDGLEIATVDSFQGREKEAIIISCVRSNDEGNVGFLADSRRMNVAITRARRHVCIVCDSSTISQDNFLSEMIDYASEHAEYRAANLLS